MSGLYGVSAYQQTKEVWNSRTNRTNAGGSEKADSRKVSDARGTEKTAATQFTTADTKSALVPSVKDGYGTVIGDVTLSDKAKTYYEKLKAKFYNMDFILVSQDKKAQVQANAASYGNAAKLVVLIDDEKIERMATDESFRKKYEGILTMSQLKLQEAKNSLSGSGAAVKNFGMSVDSKGKTSFFAAIEKTAKKQAQKKAAEKKQAEKKADRAREEKLAEKKAAEKKAAEKEEKAADAGKFASEPEEEKTYVIIRADSMEELLNKVAAYSYENSEKTVVSEKEKLVGQNIDFKG